MKALPQPVPILLIFVLIFSSSCSVVKKDSYYQSRKYSIHHTHLWNKSNKEWKLKRSMDFSEHAKVESLTICNLAHKQEKITAELIHPDMVIPSAPSENSVLTRAGVQIVKEQIRQIQDPPDDKSYLKSGKIHWLVFLNLGLSLLAPILFFVPLATMSAIGLTLGILALILSGICLYLMKQGEIQKDGKTLVYVSAMLSFAFLMTISAMSLMLMLIVKIAT
jgi:hypothetical protein